MCESVNEWTHFQQWCLEIPELQTTLDLSRSGLTQKNLAAFEQPCADALAGMVALEAGALANPDEQRQVGHYWLRNPELAPTREIMEDIRNAWTVLDEFTQSVHAGTLVSSTGTRFRNLLLVGIGGSVLGPQLVHHAFRTATDPLRVWFLDNTDPDGFDRVREDLGTDLAATLVVVVSKSGGTKETRNGMLETQAWFAEAGLDFAKHAVAVTGAGSELDHVAETQNWLRRFPMWSWVGGRTSELAVVGLLPAALQGVDWRQLIAGAREMDVQTRNPKLASNPALLLAVAWHLAGEGQGKRALVVLPYKDRLELFGRYLQQLVMESLGKARDLSGATVHQGLTVYGNKGSTDQHAYVQQLREGPDDCFVTFLAVRKDRRGASREVEPGITSGDYLHGFWLGTRAALTEAGRRSVSLVLDCLTPRTLGALIALFERTVGYYAELIGINAYHQPGVEAGKVAANEVLQLQQKLLGVLRDRPAQNWSAETLAETLGQPQSVELVFHLLEHLAANQRLLREAGQTPFDATFRITAPATPA